MRQSCSSAADIWSGIDRVRQAVAANLSGQRRGVVSVCCTHPLVIEAASDLAVAADTDLLIEATANQVNQFGGYTGMRPADFRDSVLTIARARGLAPERIVLGGDHLGPVCWTNDPPELAMDKAEALVRAYAAAGYSKIHLDCSMPLIGDPAALDDRTVAARAARLCAAADAAAAAAFGSSRIGYVIGTEVPPPGGANEALNELAVTPAANVRRTLDTHCAVFAEAGLADAWQRVMAVVVQPGVEFDHSAVIDFDPARARDLKQLAESPDNTIAFEAHSTDYQLAHALAELVNYHFAILKVGPALTFALREALFALGEIEDECVPAGRRSNLRSVCEERMVARPGDWQSYYRGDSDQQRRLRRYSLSDRIRYYWPDPAIVAASERLFTNLASVSIPLGLLRQYLPFQALVLRESGVSNDPTSLVKWAVRNALAPYIAACRPERA